MIDWGEAIKVAAIGFAGVFVILTILYLIIYAVGMLIHRLAPEEKEDNSEGGGR